MEENTYKLNINSEESITTILISQWQSDHLHPVNKRLTPFWIPNDNQTTHLLWMTEQQGGTDKQDQHHSESLNDNQTTYLL